MERREFLMQAHKLDLDKHDVTGWWVSEKLDGTRAFWDGGMSRDMDIMDVPWANIYHPKTGELKKNLKPKSTGLWSRYGNPIIAPDWFLNHLPSMFLDGELFAGRGNFQMCRSIVAGNEPGPDWDKIQYAVYGTPSFDKVFRNGEIKNPNFHRIIDHSEMWNWYYNLSQSGRCEDMVFVNDGMSFETELEVLQENLPECCDVVYMLKQAKLNSLGDLHRMMKDIVSAGGEGVVVRDPTQQWVPKRVKGLLKCKPTFDAEATVTGFTSGRKTDKGSKLLGLIGAIITEFEGKRLEIAGLTNAERRFLTPAMTSHAIENPGVDMPEDFKGVEFKIGDTLTFKYRELTDDGLPKEAHYWRKRKPE
jgi:DNA ligase-1